MGSEGGEALCDRSNKASIWKTLGRFVLVLVCVGWGLAAAAAPPASHAGRQALRIEVFKAKRLLLVMKGKTTLKRWTIALGSDPVSPKRREGDRATPEGTYRVTHKNPHSRFYRSLALSYPNSADAARGLRDGLITRAQYKRILSAAKKGRTPPQGTKLGGDVFIHGGGTGQDWTWGCIALSDVDMKVLFRIVPVGTRVTIHH